MLQRRFTGALYKCGAVDPRIPNEDGKIRS